MLELADALESQGNPDGARAALRRFEPQFASDARYWTERAAVDEHVGDLEGALFSVREVSRNFAGSVEPARESELLWSLDRPQEALEVARQQARTVSPSAVSFWKLFGDLAWSLDEDADASTAYQHVWDAGAGDAEVAERLATVLVAQGRIDDLGSVGAEAYQKLGASSVLLTAMEAATDARALGVRSPAGQHRGAARGGLRGRAGVLVGAGPPGLARRQGGRSGWPRLPGPSRWRPATAAWPRICTRRAWKRAWSPIPKTPPMPGHGPPR